MTTWRERIAKMIETQEVPEEYVRMLSSWTTCAVGEQHQLHPGWVVMDDWEPADRTLWDLGMSVWDNVRRATLSIGMSARRRYLLAAEASLDAIEDRVLELKREAANSQ